MTNTNSTPYLAHYAGYIYDVEQAVVDNHAPLRPTTVVNTNVVEEVIHDYERNRIYIERFHSVVYDLMWIFWLLAIAVGCVAGLLKFADSPSTTVSVISLLCLIIAIISTVCNIGVAIYKFNRRVTYEQALRGIPKEILVEFIRLVKLSEGTTNITTIAVTPETIEAVVQLDTSTKRRWPTYIE